MSSQVGRLCSEMHNKLFEVNKLTKFMTFKTRLAFVNSFVIGKLLYALPVYVGMDKSLYKKLHKVIMRAARVSIGNFCFKKSISYILEKCDMFDSENCGLFSAMKLLYSIRVNNDPKAMISLFKNKNTRIKNLELHPTINGKTVKLKNSCLQNGAKIFNHLPHGLKVGNKVKFAENLKVYIRANKNWDKKADL